MSLGEQLPRVGVSRPDVIKRIARFTDRQGYEIGLVEDRTRVAALQLEGGLTARAITKEANGTETEARRWK